MAEKKYTWHKIADHVNEIEFAENDIAIATVNDKKICIGKHDQKIFAFAYKCPHAGGLLAYGYIDTSGNVICPQHRYKFNMHNGYNVSGEGYFLKTWPVEIKDDGIFVGFEEKSGLFGWFN